MTPPHHPPSLALSTISILLLLTTPTYALGVSKSAAIGICVGLGTLLLFSIFAVLFMKLSPKWRRERAARREARAYGAPEPTNAELIAMHNQTAPKNFDIWGYDHKAFLAKKAKKEEQAQRGAVETIA